MKYYLLIILGLMLIIFGVYKALQFLADLQAKLERLDDLLDRENPDRISSLEKQMDELNYSYYQISNQLIDRMDQLEAELAKKHKHSGAEHTSKAPAKKPTVENAVVAVDSSSQTRVKSSKTTAKKSATVATAELNSEASRSQNKQEIQYKLSENNLTDGQKQIQVMIKAGFSDSEIAKTLAIGSGEVAIIRKLISGD